MNYTNITFGTTNTPTICSINQFEMMNQLTRTPKVAYWFLFAVFVILLLYIFIPKFKEYVSADRLIYPVFMLILTSLTFYSLTTFNITQDIYKKILEPILYIICAIGIIYIFVKERKNIKEIYKKIKEHEY